MPGCSLASFTVIVNQPPVEPWHLFVRHGALLLFSLVLPADSLSQEFFHPHICSSRKNSHYFPLITIRVIHKHLYCNHFQLLSHSNLVHSFRVVMSKVYNICLISKISKSMRYLISKNMFDVKFLPCSFLPWQLVINLTALQLVIFSLFISQIFLMNTIHFVSLQWDFHRGFSR